MTYSVPDGGMEFKDRAVHVEPHRRGKDKELAKKVREMSEGGTEVNRCSLLEKTWHENANLS